MESTLACFSRAQRLSLLDAALRFNVFVAASAQAVFDLHATYEQRRLRLREIVAEFSYFDCRASTQRAVLTALSNPVCGRNPVVRLHFALPAP